MPEYLGREVFDFRPNFTGEETEQGQIDDFTYRAPAGGFAVPWKPTTGPKRTLLLPFLLESFDDIKIFRAFIAALHGRKLGFWLPIWFTDFVPVGDLSAGSATVLVKNTGLTSRISFGTQFRHIAIITRTSMDFYRVDACEVSGANEIISLDRILENDLDASETVVCGLMYARLGDDEIEYEYLSGAVAKVSLRFVELPKETEGDAHLGTTPIYLYQITQGSAQWKLTNYPVDVILDAETWDTEAIEHGEIREDVEFTADPFKISFTTDNPAHPIRKLLDPNLLLETTIEIFLTDLDNPDPDDIINGPIYKGRVGRPQFGERGEIEVECSSMMRIAETELPQLLTERTCIHKTYDGNCALVAGTFTTTGPIDVISSSPAYIEATEFGAKAILESDPNWFALGLVTVGVEKRLCTGQVGNRLYLNAPFKSAIVGNSASARAGDDHTIDTCANKFDNVINFLGFPYLPNRDPQFEALETPKPEGGKK